jgi:hypothetical protein
MRTHMIRSRGRLRLRPDRGVEDGAPLAVRHPPDGGAVVDAGILLPPKEPSIFAWQVTIAVSASGMTTFMSLRAKDCAHAGSSGKVR